MNARRLSLSELTRTVCYHDCLLTFSSLYNPSPDCNDPARLALVLQVRMTVVGIFEGLQLGGGRRSIALSRVSDRWPAFGSRPG
jgi:hypothetical protein